jgi:hypothetical protein
MSNDDFNISMRKFLKSVGVTSQQKIEEAVRSLGSSTDADSINITVTIQCDDINLSHEIKGAIQLP